MNDKSEVKASRERNIFESFSRSAGLILAPGSLLSQAPPAPDIQCEFGGRRHFCELVEIVDTEIARMVEQSIRTGKADAASYSSIEPLDKVFAKKSANDYAIDGAPLHLLAYYEKQSSETPFGADFIEQRVGAVARQMISSGRWHSIWVYDHGNKKVLWSLSH